MEIPPALQTAGCVRERVCTVLKYQTAFRRLWNWVHLQTCLDRNLGCRSLALSLVSLVLALLLPLLLLPVPDPVIKRPLVHVLDFHPPPARARKDKMPVLTDVFPHYLAYYQYFGIFSRYLVRHACPPSRHGSLVAMATGSSGHT